jgi:hypothetical protein
VYRGASQQLLSNYPVERRGMKDRYPCWHGPGAHRRQFIYGRLKIKIDIHAGTGLVLTEGSSYMDV